VRVFSGRVGSVAKKGLDEDAVVVEPGTLPERIVDESDDSRSVNLEQYCQRI
jgi:hypothetical protein